MSQICNTVVKNEEDGCGDKVVTTRICDTIANLETSCEANIINMQGRETTTKTQILQILKWGGPVKKNM